MPIKTTENIVYLPVHFKINADFSVEVCLRKGFYAADGVTFQDLDLFNQFIPSEIAAPIFLANGDITKNRWEDLKGQVYTYIISSGAIAGSIV